jgi:hypothetical protein
MKRRLGERGAEAVELVAGLPLLGLVVILIWQGLVLAGQQAEAQNDARIVARQHAMCGSGPDSLDLTRIDGNLNMANIDTTGSDSTVVSVTVSFRPHIVLLLPGFAEVLDRDARPHARVTMRREPC